MHPPLEFKKSENKRCCFVTSKHQALVNMIHTYFTKNMIFIVIYNAHTHGLFFVCLCLYVTLAMLYDSN